MQLQPRFGNLSLLTLELFTRNRVGCAVARRRDAVELIVEITPVARQSLFLFLEIAEKPEENVVRQGLERMRRFEVGAHGLQIG